MIHHGDCLEVMATMEPESVDAVVTDPPYGLEFMGKEWDKLKPDVRANRGGKRAPGRAARTGQNFAPVAYGGAPRRSTYVCDICGKRDKFMKAHGDGGGWSPMRLPDDNVPYARSMQAWHARWAEAAYRVAKPSAYLLAFGGTRTVHRMTVALEDAGWIIRDMLVWGYASGFPKSKASLKPAWEPIVMARKPGPLRMLAIDECRIPLTGAEAVDDRYGEPTADTRYGDKVRATPGRRIRVGGGAAGSSGFAAGYERGDGFTENTSGRWPANIVLTDPIFDGAIEGVVGGGEQRSPEPYVRSVIADGGVTRWTTEADGSEVPGYGDSGTYSRFFLIPKADRADREPVVLPDGHDRTKRFSSHPTVKPTDLMRHLVRLVTPPGGTVLDPFLGSGTTGLAAELEGFPWVGIEKEREYCDIAEARLNGTQRGIGL